MPHPPSVSGRFTDLVTGTDFFLIDEFEGDNSQMVLLTIPDGCDRLQRYSGMVSEWQTRIAATTDPALKHELRGEALQLTREYDKTLEMLRVSSKNALRDIKRRLQEAGLWRQLNRPFGHLPTGSNPPPIKAGDPRLSAEGR